MDEQNENVKHDVAIKTLQMAPASLSTQVYAVEDGGEGVSKSDCTLAGVTLGGKARAMTTEKSNLKGIRFQPTLNVLAALPLADSKAWNVFPLTHHPVKFRGDEHPGGTLPGGGGELFAVTVPQRAELQFRPALGLLAAPRAPTVPDSQLARLGKILLRNVKFGLDHPLLLPSLPIRR